MWAGVSDDSEKQLKKLKHKAMEMEMEMEILLSLSLSFLFEVVSLCFFIMKKYL